MRTLSPQEITQIDQRIESLKIYYIEIYHELRDHYFTELEKKSAEEFESTFRYLNESFACSVVKKIEKELRKATNQKVTRMQWDALKPWKMTAIDILIVSCCAIGYYISYKFLSVEGIVLFVASMALIGLIIVLKLQSQGLSWSLKVSRQKPVRSISTTIMARLALFYSVLSWFYFGISNWSTSNPGVIGEIFLLISSMFVFFYILTLVKVATTIKSVEVNLKA